MDAVEFLKTSYRMCNTYEDCNACPVDTYACYIHGGNCRKNPDGVVAVVEQWAKNNPVKTRQSEFLRMFPNAQKIDEIINICPILIDKDCKSTSECLGTRCNVCRQLFWNEEVTDND